MEQGYLKRDVFERLYSTTTVAFRMKFESPSEKIPAPRVRKTRPIDPTSRLVNSTSTYKQRMSVPRDPVLSTPKKKTPNKRVSKPTSTPRAPVRTPTKKSTPARTPTKTYAAVTTSSAKKVVTPVKKTPTRPAKTAPPVIEVSTPVAPKAPSKASSAGPATPDTVNSTPPSTPVAPVVSSIGNLPSTEDLVDMIEIPIDDKLKSLYSSLDITACTDEVPLDDIVAGMKDLYPEIASDSAINHYKAFPNHKLDALSFDDFKYFLLFVVYFFILYEDFLFIDDDDLRVAKGEFTPVAERLNIFEDVDAAFEEMAGGTDHVMFGNLCVKCASIKQSSL